MLITITKLLQDPTTHADGLTHFKDAPASFIADDTSTCAYLFLFGSTEKTFEEGQRILKNLLTNYIEQVKDLKSRGASTDTLLIASCKLLESHKRACLSRSSHPDIRPQVLRLLDLDLLKLAIELHQEFPKSDGITNYYNKENNMHALFMEKSVNADWVRATEHHSTPSTLFWANSSASDRFIIYTP